MREIATTLTDYLLAAVSFAAAFALFTQPPPARNIGPLLFFIGFAFATLIGGTWHGFFSAPDAPAAEFVWWLSMVFAGLSSAGLAVSGLELMEYRNRSLLLAGTALFVTAFGAYVWLDPRFLSSLLASAIGTVICIAGLVRQLRLGASTPAAMALAALTLSILGAIAQQSGIAMHPVHFDRNATYHLFLVPALGLFYAGLRRIAH